MASYFTRFVKLSFKLAHLEDEEWKYDEEPHTNRRQRILKAHPEIKTLMGHDPLIAYITSSEVVIQMFMCWMLQDARWPVILFFSYIISGSLNHSLGSAIHEIGHNLAFGHKYPLCNRALGMLCNLPLVIPFSVSYKKYHTNHHRYLGHDTKDVDIPSVIESHLFRNWVTKSIWLLLHPFIHALRPFFKDPLPPTKLEFINCVVQITFDLIILKVFGVKALTYLALGTMWGFGFHPLAGHFISEHYLFQNGKHATYSYYGPLNPVVFNVGYHVEHHDFPYIPYTRLPKVRQMAPEFYEGLPSHDSWIKVLWDFIFDPEMGPHARGVGYKLEAEEKSCKKLD